MEASEVPAKGKSLKKSLSDKTSAGFQTPPSPQPGKSFRSSESMAAGGPFDAWQTPPRSKFGGSIQKGQSYAAVGSFQNLYSERSPASPPTPDSAKSSSNHSGSLSRASAESKYWNSNQTPEIVTGVISGSRNYQGKSPGTKVVRPPPQAPPMPPRPGEGVTLYRQRREEALNRASGGSNIYMQYPQESNGYGGSNIYPQYPQRIN